MDIGGSLSWSAVHDEVAKITRTCTYSRAGIMWSDPAPGPRNSKAIAEDLHTALLKAGEQPPFVLVGHSAGGPYIMAFTKHFGSEVAGLVFVDASHPEQEQRFKAFTPASGSPWRSLVHKMLAKLAWTGLTRTVLALSTRGAPPPANIHAYAPTSMTASFKELNAWEQTLAEAGNARQLGDRPIYVLTSLAPTPEEILTRSGRTVAQDRQIKEAWKTMQEDLASWSSHSRHEVLPDAGHYIQFDRPDAVVAAVRSVAEAASVRADDWTAARRTMAAGESVWEELD